MLGGATGRFTDANDYGGNLPEVAAELVVTQVGAFDARLTWARLPNVQLLRAQETLARAAYMALPASALFVSFATQPGPEMCWNGVGLLPGDMVFHSRGEHLHQRISGACQWGFLSIAPAFFAAFGSSLAGRQLLPPPVGRTLEPSPADLRRLLRLHAKIGNLIETKPVAIVHPEVARAMEHGLLHALVTCLTSRDIHDGRSANPDQVEIMGRFEAVLATQPDSGLSVREICETLQISEHTLRVCCRAFVGIGPAHYLTLRRLNLARAAILAADTDTLRLDEIARRFGFREADRFTAVYRKAYGETPSAIPVHLRNAG